jgi:hypothetical protein
MALPKKSRIAKPSSSASARNARSIPRINTTHAESTIFRFLRRASRMVIFELIHHWIMSVQERFDLSGFSCLNFNSKDNA